MKLYTTGKGHWAGTQADARKLKKEHGVPCDMHEVPVAKQELLDFLNRNTVTTGVAQDVPKRWQDIFAEEEDSTTPDDVPKHAPVDDVTERSSDKEAFIGKTTILVGGFFHKLHCYYYTENWEDGE
jgi:hypothetical protein